jgi:hypothetical protein
MLGTVLERFIQMAPVAVMVRGILERALGDEVLNGLFEQAADRQYTRQLLLQRL